MKVIRVTMDNGDKYDIMAHAVAGYRAEYYSEKDNPEGTEEEKEATYKAEYQITMADDFELRDWAENNMNWEDVSNWVVDIHYGNSKPDFQESWCNGEKEILDNGRPYTGEEALKKIK